MKQFLMTLALGLTLGACGGVVTTEEPGAEQAPLEQTGQEIRCGFCGDGYCCPDVETSAGCPADCGPVLTYCGDGTCNGGETSASCPSDCGAAHSCGDDVCNSGETALNCPLDCGPATCGDGICQSNETSMNCLPDCPCGLGKCPY